MMPQRHNPMDSFFQAFMMGQQMKAQRDAMEMEKQDRALKIEALQQEAKRLKLQDKMQAFQMLKGQRGPMMEQPGEEIPALFSPGGQMGVQGPPQMVEGQHPEFDFSELQPGLTMRPQNMGDMVREQISQRQREMAMRGQELEQEQSIKAQFANPVQEVEVPGLGQMSGPQNILPGMMQALLAQQEKGADREFRAAEGAKDRASRESLAAAGRSHDYALESHRAKLRPSESEKPLSAEAAVKLSTVESLDRELGSIEKRLTGDGEKPIGGLQFRMRAAGAVTGADATLTKSVKNAADLLGRLRSQGAINKQEEARFKDLILSWKDMVRGDPQAVRDSIASLRQEAQGISRRLTPKSKQAGNADDPLGLFK